MKREDMIKRIAKRANMSQKDILPILEVIEDETLYAISMEEEMPFKFGKIGGKTVAERDGVNPKTGEKIKIAEKRGYPYFKASSRAKGKN
jgi:nucleoid DNA-binding protein